MNETGCTTIYEPNLENICTDSNLAKNASDMYLSLFNSKMKDHCHYPCTYLMIKEENYLKTTDRYKTQGSLLAIQFNKFVTVSTTYYSYTELELLAELGGYVGLFLGVSFNSLGDLVKNIADLLCP